MDVIDAEYSIDLNLYVDYRCRSELPAGVSFQSWLEVRLRNLDRETQFSRTNP